MKIATVFLAVAFFAACTNNAGTHAETDTAEQDTVTETDAISAAEMATVHQAFPQLFTYLKSQDSTFSVDSFALSGENKMTNEPRLPVDEADLKPFRPYLIYNSDSSLAIDLYSHNYILVPHKGTDRLEEGSPDSEVALIDVAAKTRRRIFFGGPAYVLWEAKWIAPDSFLLIGTETHADDKIVPTIWQISLKDTVVKVYAYQGSVKADAGGYANQKLHMSF